MKKVLGYLALIAILFLPSCRELYPNLMFQQKDYQYFELAHKQMDQYIIEPGDELSFRLFTRDGFRLVDVLGGSAGNAGSGGGGGGLAYPVDNEGFVRLPVLGELFVKGYTEKELQKILEGRYASLFVDPFVVVTVTNRRVFVFNGSSASIISLNETPTNLFEVIAKSGGIGASAKAYKIKILRGNLGNPQILVIDLSTIEGMRKADLIIQSNDIIYIEQKQQPITSLILNEFLPYLGFVTTIISIVLLAKAY